MWLCLTFCLVSVYAVSGFDPPWMFMGRPLTGFRQWSIDAQTEKKLEKRPEFNESWFEQPLDHFTYHHFDKSTTWKQRYWYNAQFFKPNGPQFLILGGEAPGTPFDVLYEQFPHVQYAKQLNAGLWTLEHRFYGKSQPLSSPDVVNLEYLSSRQAVADIASFIVTQNKIHNCTDSKWILFGGAYAGSLALWFRDMYPELCAGAVGSSALIQPKLDFYEYLQSTEATIRSVDPTCVDNIASAFNDVTLKLLSSKNIRHRLSNSFPFKKDIGALGVSFEEIGYNYHIMISYFQALIQYNNNSEDFMFDKNDGISYICANMRINSISPYFSVAEALRNIKSKLQHDDYKIDNGYQDLINYLQISNFDDPIQVSAWAWTWQVCNEFGFFQSTNVGKSAFSNQVSVNFFINLCTDVFGLDYNIVWIQQGITSTLNRYGGNIDYQGTNVIASRGSIDPWSTLTLQESTDDSVIPYLIEGAGHCADMAPIPAQNQALVDYSVFVLAKIKTWLESPQPTTASATLP